MFSQNKEILKIYSKKDQQEAEKEYLINRNMEEQRKKDLKIA